MKRLMVLTVMLAACEPYQKEVDFPVLPPELQDCKFYFVQGTNIALYIVRCPGSTTTTTTTGKHRKTVTVID